MKLFTRMLQQHILSYITIREQQGFRKNRSTIDAVFVVRQVVKKAIEYNKPSYLCFIDLTKAFDRIMLKDVGNELNCREILPASPGR